MQRTYLESVLTQPIGVITFKNFIDVQFQRKSKYISSFSPEQQIGFQNPTYKMNNVLETSKSFLFDMELTEEDVCYRLRADFFQ